MSSSSRSTTSPTHTNTDEVLNVVNGDGDFNKNLTATGDGNTISIVETDQGAIEASLDLVASAGARAFDFGAAALDAVSASGQRANEISDTAIGAARGESQNSENLLKIVVTGAAVIALGFLGVKAIK